MMSEREPEHPDGGTPGQELSVAETLPVLARAAADAWVKTAWWSLAVSLRVGSRLARVALDPGAAIELAQGFSSGMRNYAREFLGVSDLDDRVRQLGPPAGTLSAQGRRNGSATSGPPSLRDLGAELLRRAADVEAADGAHPAYARILSELAPDEARILRLLAVEGPQPAVDVRAGNLIGGGSQLVATGLNMLGPAAGLRHRERVTAYLNNLVRLGLIDLGGEPLSDPLVYQVLEAQPDVLGTIKATSRARTIRRSVGLTDFGQDFCRVCLPVDTAEFEAVAGNGSAPARSASSSSKRPLGSSSS